MKKSINKAKVHILTNPAMPGVVRIEKTKSGSINDRLDELNSTGVPVPYECAFFAKVADETKVESAFHRIFGPYRLNSKRDFFRIEPEQAIALLELMADEAAMFELQHETDAVDNVAKDATSKLIARWPNLNFPELGIPVGAELCFFQPPHETVKVMSERTVDFRGEEVSLTLATRVIFGTDYSVGPGPYWSYRGRTLKDLYNETYEIP